MDVLSVIHKKQLNEVTPRWLRVTRLLMGWSRGLRAYEPKQVTAMESKILVSELEEGLKHPFDELPLESEQKKVGFSKWLLFLLLNDFFDQ